MIEKIPADELTSERWGSLGLEIQKGNQRPLKFNPEHFFPTVQGWMRLGFAESWGCPDALLVALFTENVFSGDMGASALCWWSRANARDSMALLDAFDAEAGRRACKQSYVSVFGSVRAKAMERLYRRRGYEPHESIMVKWLK